MILVACKAIFHIVMILKNPENPEKLYISADMVSSYLSKHVYMSVRHIPPYQFAHEDC